MFLATSKSEPSTIRCANSEQVSHPKEILSRASSSNSSSHPSMDTSETSPDLRSNKLSNEPSNKLKLSKKPNGVATRRRLTKIKMETSTLSTRTAGSNSSSSSSRIRVSVSNRSVAHLMSSKNERSACMKKLHDEKNNAILIIKNVISISRLANTGIGKRKRRKTNSCL